MTTVLAISMFLSFLSLIHASYRHLPIDSADLCAERFPNRHKRISIGTGAIILTLSKPRIAFHPKQDRAKLCEIHVEAPSGFGILAYVEEAYLRKNSTDSTCKVLFKYTHFLKKRNKEFSFFYF